MGQAFAREVKRIAEAEEPVVLIPVPVGVVQVQLAVASPAIEVSDVLVAVGVHPNRMCRISSVPPPFEAISDLRAVSYSGSKIL